jgi:hypothetical protein
MAPERSAVTWEIGKPLLGRDGVGRQLLNV